MTMFNWFKKNKIEMIREDLRLRNDILEIKYRDKWHYFISTYMEELKMYGLESAKSTLLWQLIEWDLEDKMRKRVLDSFKSAVKCAKLITKIEKRRKNKLKREIEEALK